MSISSSFRKYGQNTSYNIFENTTIKDPISMFANFISTTNSIPTSSDSFDSDATFWAYDETNLSFATPPPFLPTQEPTKFKFPPTTPTYRALSKKEIQELVEQLDVGRRRTSSSGKLYFQTPNGEIEATNDYYAGIQKLNYVMNVIMELQANSEIPVSSSPTSQKNCCSFCFNCVVTVCHEFMITPPVKDSNGPWSTHALKIYRNGEKINQCPILRVLTCKICGASGDYAHTEKHCPFLRNDDYNDIMLLFPELSI